MRHLGLDNRLCQWSLDRKTLRFWSKRSTRRLTASGAGVDMLEKHISEGRQVKTQHRPRSVEFAFAFHVGERCDDGLLYQDKRLRVKPMSCGRGTELGHAGSLAIGYTFTEAGTALTSAFAIPYLASAKLPSVVPSVALSVVLPVALTVAVWAIRPAALSFAPPE